MDLETVRTRMHEVVRILSNFTKLREEGRQRREYVNQLRRDIAAYYGYSEWMVNKILNLFPLSEVRRTLSRTVSLNSGLTRECFHDAGHGVL